MNPYLEAARRIAEGESRPIAVAALVAVHDPKSRSIAGVRRAIADGKRFRRLFDGGWCNPLQDDELVLALCLMAAIERQR